MATSTPTTTATTTGPNIFITGALGQIGTELIPYLRKLYGTENVTASDVIKPREPGTMEPFMYLNCMDKESLNAAMVNKRVTWLIHNAALLSASGEANPQKCMDVNIVGAMNALEAARVHGVRILAPSSIAAFGPDSLPKDLTPDVCVLRPTSIYGISKVYLEMLGSYYFRKFGVDFRSLRYPGIISWAVCPSGGTTDYATEMFYFALQNKPYVCPLQEDTPLPFMYMDDCILATHNLLAAPRERLTQCVYNVNGFCMTPKQLEVEIKKEIPDFKVTYSPCPIRQKIAESWPHSLDDTNAQRDWDWRPKFGIKEMVAVMFANLRPILCKTGSS
ncbi:threonine dehydrogenase [Pelomyxa schiedti]|nr:threonine dehydrogenase [Pelomyxa schiedti]